MNLNIRTVRAGIILALAPLLIFLPACKKTNIANEELYAAKRLSNHKTCVAAPQLLADNKKWLTAKKNEMPKLVGSKEKYLLYFVWTFGCYNCKNTLAWVNHIQKKYGNTIEVVGIHSPEFKWEKSKSAIKTKMKEHHVVWPTYLDDDFEIWKKLNNRYWPTVYLYDKKHCLITKMIGEIHIGDRRDQDIKKLIN